MSYHIDTVIFESIPNLEDKRPSSQKLTDEGYCLIDAIHRIGVDIISKSKGDVKVIYIEFNSIIHSHPKLHEYLYKLYQRGYWVLIVGSVDQSNSFVEIRWDLPPNFIYILKVDENHHILRREVTYRRLTYHYPENENKVCIEDAEHCLDSQKKEGLMSKLGNSLAEIWQWMISFRQSN